MTINDVLHAHDMSMAELSRRLDIPYRTLQNWKEGKREAPAYVIGLIDRVLTLENGHELDTATTDN